MKIIKTEIPDLLVIEPKVFGDDRGFFYESFNEQVWHDVMELETRFVQDNHSRSSRGVLRGLHYQLPPAAQGKLVRCIVGEIFDVAVDLRKGARTFSKWVGEVLSAENKRQLWIPEGFAHGFLVLSDTAEVLYKATNYYCPEMERCIRWDDPDLAIVWPSDTSPVLSAKDAVSPLFCSAELFT